MPQRETEDGSYQVHQLNDPPQFEMMGQPVQGFQTTFEISSESIGSMMVVLPSYKYSLHFINKNKYPLVVRPKPYNFAR